MSLSKRSGPDTLFDACPQNHEPMVQGQACLANHAPELYALIGLTGAFLVMT